MRDEFYWLGQINKATIVINEAQGLLSAEMARRAARGVQTVLDSGTDPANRVTRVIDFEPKLIEAAGTEVTVIHVGRSSQDMHSTYRSAIMRDNCLAVTKTLQATIKALLALADQHIETHMPAYTNGVAAQPTTFAHYLLGYVDGFKRDHGRLTEFYRRLNTCPMGSCVINGTGWPLNRTAMAQHLGFDAPTDNAFDATQISMVDLGVEFAQIQSSIGLHVGEMIADIMVQYAQPRPWMLLAAGSTYVSSAMPQKRNPGVLSSCRGNASDIVSQACGVMMRAHNVPSGMIDGKSVKVHTALTTLTVKTLERFMQILTSLVINKDRALEELNLDWTASQEIADRLMREYGVAFRVGHHVASAMVTYARSNGILPLTFPYAEMQRIYAETISKELPGADTTCPMSEAEFKAALDPKSIVAARATQGGCAPGEVSRMLADRLSWLKAMEEATEHRAQAIDDAMTALDREFDAFLN